MFWKTNKNEFEKDTQLSTLENNLKELWKEEEDITIKLRCEKDLRQKRRLELEKGKLYVQIQNLQGEKEKIEDIQATPKTDSLIRENSSIIVIEVNKRIIPTTEKVKIPFSCGHMQEFILREILRKYNYVGNTHEPERNRFLLQRWKMVIEQNDSFTREFHCEQCKKHIQKLKAKDTHRNNLVIGNAIVKIRRLQ